ncbi:hypothetical protein KSF73_09890 [Burkholderiaceae bacterium DAT-1]|nr:hypothetical protein [Burkholderiaceae bacterium DAT-1]
MLNEQNLQRATLHVVFSHQPPKKVTNSFWMNNFLFKIHWLISRKNKRSQMGRPTIGEAGTFRRALLQNILKEIKQISGLTIDALAEALALPSRSGETVSPEMLRQYFSCLKSVSEQKIFAVVNAAEKLGWSGPVTRAVKGNFLEEMMMGTGFGGYHAQDLSRKLESIGNDPQKLTKQGLARIKAGVNKLLEAGWAEQDVAFMAIATLENSIDPYDLSGGGGLLSNPPQMPIYRPGIAPAQSIGFAWQSCTMREMTEIFRSQSLAKIALS